MESARKSDQSSFEEFQMDGRWAAQVRQQLSLTWQIKLTPKACTVLRSVMHILASTLSFLFINIGGFVKFVASEGKTSYAWGSRDKKQGTECQER